MAERRTATTLAGPRRCPYCGHRCHGERSCEFCADLARGEAAALREPKRPAKRKPRTPDFRATCPNCGELSSPSAFACALCGTALYLPKSDRLYRPPTGDGGVSWRPGEPRFLVREVDGYSMLGHFARPGGNTRLLLSVSALDAAYNYAEVARFNQEDVRGYSRLFKSDDARESIRNRAAGLAAMCEAEYAA